MINLKILEEYVVDINEDEIKKVAKMTLTHQSLNPRIDISIVINNDEFIKILNQKYMGGNSSTDVLAFPADLIDPETETAYLGDVIISYPTAVSNAETNGRSPQSELNLLVVHGMLHLAGHDHDNDAKKTIMWRAQNDILSNLGENII